MANRKKKKNRVGALTAVLCVMLTLALAAGASPEEAADLSNFAAGIVVGKVGTSPVAVEELRSEIKFRKPL